MPRADKANSFFNNLMVFVSLKIIWHCGLFTADGPRLHARVRARRELAAGRRVRVLQPAGGEQRLRVALLHLHAADAYALTGSGVGLWPPTVRAALWLNQAERQAGRRLGGHARRACLGCEHRTKRSAGRHR